MAKLFCVNDGCHLLLEGSVTYCPFCGFLQSGVAKSMEDGSADFSYEIQDVNEYPATEPLVGVKLPESEPKPSRSTPRDPNSSETVRDISGSSGIIGTVCSGIGGGSVGKWIFVPIIIIFVIYFIKNNNDQKNRKLAYNFSPLQSYSMPNAVPADPTSNITEYSDQGNLIPIFSQAPSPIDSIPSVTEYVSLQYEYIEPPVGDNNQLTIAQMRWCFLQENIIESLRFDVLTEKAREQFNIMVSDYNNRCSSYQYHTDDWTQALHEVEMDRNSAITESIGKQNSEEPHEP